MNPRKHLVALLFFFFQLGPLVGQGVLLRGVVLDAQTNDPIVGATVAFEDTSLSPLHSAADGTFHTTSAAQQVLATVSYFGYQSQTVTLLANQLNTIALKAQPQALAVVTVSAERPRENGLKALPQLTLSDKDFSRNSSAGLGETLSQIDGVTFISTGTNIQLPVIHGLYGNRILMLNNGFKHGFQNWGTDHAPEIDVVGAAAITVVKGAAGVKYGPDALGGAVLIESQNLRFNNPFYGKATTTFQTNGRGYGSNVQLGRGGKNFSYHIGANANRIGDRKAPNYRLTNTGARDYAVQGGLRYRYRKWAVKSQLSSVQQNWGILRAAIGNSGPALIRNMEASKPTYIQPFSYAINEPNQRVQHHMATAEVARHFEKSTLVLRMAQQWNARKEFDVRRNADLPILDLSLSTSDVQLEWEHQWTEKVKGAWGVQYFSQSNTNNPGTSITPFIPNYASSRYSAYAFESITTSEKSTWELGFRLDWEQHVVAGRDSRQVVFQDNFTFRNSTLSFGNTYQVSSTTTWRNHIGSGWRPPNMAELFSFGQHESQTTFGLLRYEPDTAGFIQAMRVVPIGESQVQPENSVKYTSEWDWQGAKNRFTITSYANYITNFIFSRPIGVLGTARGPMPTFIFDQTNALFLGADLTYTTNYHKNGTAKIGGSYIYSRNTTRNETLINQPPIALHAQFKHSFYQLGKVDNIVVALLPSYTFRQFQAPRTIAVRDLVAGTTALAVNDPIFDFQAAPAGYFLLHAFITIQKGPFALNLEVRNALNTSYRDYLNNMRYFADELGINFISSLSYQF